MKFVLFLALHVVSSKHLKSMKELYTAAKILNTYYTDFVDVIPSEGPLDFAAQRQRGLNAYKQGITFAKTVFDSRTHIQLEDFFKHAEDLEGSVGETLELFGLNEFYDKVVKQFGKYRRDVLEVNENLVGVVNNFVSLTKQAAKAIDFTRRAPELVIPRLEVVRDSFTKAMSRKKPEDILALDGELDVIFTELSGEIDHHLLSLLKSGSLNLSRAQMMEQIFKMNTLRKDYKGSMILTIALTIFTCLFW